METVRQPGRRQMRVARIEGQQGRGVYRKCVKQVTCPSKWQRQYSIETCANQPCTHAKRAKKKTQIIPKVLRFGQVGGGDYLLGQLRGVSAAIRRYGHSFDVMAGGRGVTSFWLRLEELAGNPLVVF